MQIIEPYLKRFRRLCVVGVLGALLAACASAPKVGDALVDCEGCPELVVIPPGGFAMGFDGGEKGRPEGPVRQIYISQPFAVGKYEITQAQFRDFVEASGHTPKGGCRVWNDGEWGYPEDKDWRDPGYGRPPMAQDAVTCVSWLDAKAYTRWLSKKSGKSYRLLTEAEWEYVARAGTTTKWFWGNKPEDGCAYDNMYDQTSAQKWNFNWEPVPCDDGFAEVAPVGSLKPNPFGVYDILGNMWEWTEDCYVAPYPDQPTDGSPIQVEGPCELRTVRGGSWITRASRHRAAFRGRDPEPTLYSFFGFRVARDLADDEVDSWPSLSF